MEFCVLMSGSAQNIARKSDSALSWFRAGQLSNEEEARFCRQWGCGFCGN